MIGRALGASVLGLLAGLSLDASAQAVHVVTIAGDINSAVADFLGRAVERSELEGSVALIVELDTPGGTLDATREIVSDLLNAEVPVVVFVSPRGAWAASAGTFITLAAHVAAMAPGTSIGAAHPVSMFGGGPLPPVPTAPGDEEGEEKPTQAPQLRDYMNEKVENFTAAFIESIAEERGRNAEWAVEAVRSSVAIKPSEALEKGVIDLVADDLDELLQKLEGRVVQVAGDEVALGTARAHVVRIEMTASDRFLKTISNPAIALLLLLLAAAGIYIEVQSPGLIAPGAIGVVALILAALAFQVIPFNWVGLLLIALGLGLMVAELFITSFGLLFAGGIVCIAVGSFMVFRVPELSDISVPFWSLIFPMVVVLSGFMAIVVFGVIRSFRRPQFAGAEALVGEIAVAESDLDPKGRVRFRGELWGAESETPASRGDNVEILEVHDLLVRVRPVPGAAGGDGC